MNRIASWGPNDFDERRRHSIVDRLASRLERLGYRGDLDPVAATCRVSYFQGNPRTYVPERGAPKGERTLLGLWKADPLPSMPGGVFWHPQNSAQPLVTTAQPPNSRC